MDPDAFRIACTVGQTIADGSSIGWARGEVSAWRPLIAMAAMLLIVRNSDETQRRMLNRI